MHLFDFPNEYSNKNVPEAASKQFQDHYLSPLGDDIRYVCLQSRFRVKYQDYILI